MTKSMLESKNNDCQLGATAVYGTPYGKPNKAVHVSNVNCDGSEERIGDCTKTSISLSEGKTTYKYASVAGIKCLPPPDPTCVDNTDGCLLYTSPSPRDGLLSRMPSSA